MRATTTPHRDWAVVLAAGDGARMRPLTRLLQGADVPKQFAKIDGERSLLQTTLERIFPRFAPERTVVVVGKEHEAVARQQLADYDGIDIVIQPRNLGTGPGLLLPLARVFVRDRGARVAVFPSDHHVASPEPLLAGVDSALEASNQFRVGLIGVKPDRAETEYGWIVPDPVMGKADPFRTRAIQRFLEKPDHGQVGRLLRQGALWNTFICTGRLVEFWALAWAWLPSWARVVEGYVSRLASGDGEAYLEWAYREGQPANFSHEVLARATRLGVTPVEGTGWSDWGSPRRVLQCLHANPGGQRLLARISAAHPSSAELTELGLEIPALPVPA